MADLDIDPTALRQVASNITSATSSLLEQCGEVSAAVSSAQQSEQIYAYGLHDVLSRLGANWDIQLESITTNLNAVATVLGQIADLFESKEQSVSAAISGSQ